MRGSLFCAFLVLLFSLVMAGCETPDVTTVDTADFSTSASIAKSASAAKLASGDTIELSVEVDGRMEVPLHQATINYLGFVTLPLIGDVQVGGLGLDIARAILTKRYGSLYVTSPVIMLSMVSEENTSEWGQVSVMGRVNNPGPVQLPSGAGMRLSAAIQAAGGFAPSAKTAEIQVTRIDKRGRRLRVVVDFNEIGASGNADADIKLMDGDIVNVPERIW